MRVVHVQVHRPVLALAASPPLPHLDEGVYCVCVLPRPSPLAPRIRIYRRLFA